VHNALYTYMLLNNQTSHTETNGLQRPLVPTNSAGNGCVCWWAWYL